MTPSEIKPGMKFGHWTVLKFSHMNKHRIKYFLCRCTCGTERTIRGTALIQGISTACSSQCDNSLVGQRFGRLTVVSRDRSHTGKWFCNCDCGVKNVSLKGSSLKAGMIKSCGCYFNRPGKNGTVSQETLEKYNSLVGKKIGKLLVLRSVDDGNFRCMCDCGKEFSVDKASVFSGNTQSCGCARMDTYLKNQEAKYKSFVGTNVNKLTIDSCYYKNNTFWFDCSCECGKKVTRQATKVANRYYYSCGCAKSSAEEELEKILLKEGVRYKREYKLSDCRDKMPLPFDFAIFNQFGELVGLVELNGRQHYCVGGWSAKERLEYTQRHDKIKLRFCCENDIPLLVIPYQYYNELEKFLMTSDFWQTVTKNFND